MTEPAQSSFDDQHIDRFVYNVWVIYLNTSQRRRYHLGCESISLGGLKIAPRGGNLSAVVETFMPWWKHLSRGGNI